MICRKDNNRHCEGRHLLRWCTEKTGIRIMSSWDLMPKSEIYTTGNYGLRLFVCMSSNVKSDYQDNFKPYYFFLL